MSGMVQNHGILRIAWSIVAIYHQLPSKPEPQSAPTSKQTRPQGAKLGKLGRGRPQPNLEGILHQCS